MTKKKTTSNKGYWTNTWRGMTKYNCNKCAFDSLSKERMDEHLKTEHLPPPTKRAIKVPMYDRYGNKINEIEK